MLLLESTTRSCDVLCNYVLRSSECGHLVKLYVAFNLLGSESTFGTLNTPDLHIQPSIHPPLQKKRLPGLVVMFTAVAPRTAVVVVALGHPRHRRGVNARLRRRGAADDDSQGHLPHGMRHALERQPPLAARRPGPVREQARLAQVEVAPARGGRV